MNTQPKPIVIFTRTKIVINTGIKGEHVYYPESHMTIEEQLQPFTRRGCDVLVTNSPFLISQFKQNQVYVHDNTGINPVEFNTYGADIEILIKRLCSLNSTMSRVVIDDIKSKLNSPDAIDYLQNNVGDSMEKAYLIRKLNLESK